MNAILDEAKITSKGQITIPVKVRKALGVKEGDKLAFEEIGTDIVVRPVKKKSNFEKYRGIGTPGVGSGLEAVINSVRQLRDPE